MHSRPFPTIDMVATGQNIVRLRKERGLSVRDLQIYFGFSNPQAIYKWQKGKSLPSVDNLYALGLLLEIPLEKILIPTAIKPNISHPEQQAAACCSFCFCSQFQNRCGYRLLHPFSIVTLIQIPVIELLVEPISFHL